MKTVSLLATGLIVALVVALGSTAWAAGNSDNGMGIFLGKGKCKTCHDLGATKKVGPGLKGVTTRHSEDWLKKWLADPQGTWEGNDPETEGLKRMAKRSDKSHTPMHPPKFTDQEIEDIIAYLRLNDTK